MTGWLWQCADVRQRKKIAACPAVWNKERKMEWIRKEQDRVVAVIQFFICLLALVLAVLHEVKAVEKLHRKIRKKADRLRRKRVKH